MKYLLLRLKRFCGFITGFVFFIGGILKLMDPVGAGLVMGEYLDFMHLKFLGFASKPLGIAFALAETIIGTALITGRNCSSGIPGILHPADACPRHIQSSDGLRMLRRSDPPYAHGDIPEEHRAERSSLHILFPA